MTVVSMYEVGLVHHLDIEVRKSTAQGTEVIGGVIRSGTLGRIRTLRHTEIEPHVSSLKERHCLARDLKEEFELEHITIEGDRAIEVCNRDVQLGKPHDVRKAGGSRGDVPSR